MRLDKLLAHSGFGTRKEVKELIKKGFVSVNDETIKTDKMHVDPQKDVVKVDDEVITYEEKVYYMLNKPSGYVSATEDQLHPTVVDLIDDYYRNDLFPVGRLDIDTTGLLLITNDKTLSKRLLLPENHIDKKYYVTVKNKLTDDLIEIFNNGIIIDQKVKCKPSYLEIIDDYHCYLTINEGRYHQIKKMFLSCNNKVLELKRVMFASIHLDNNLSLGNYRKLNNQEIKQLITINNTK